MMGLFAVRFEELLLVRSWEMIAYLGLGFEALPGSGEDLAVVVSESVGSHGWVLGCGMLWIGWLLEGLGGVGGCTLYENWLDVKVVDGVMSLGIGSGSLERSRERVDVSASIPIRGACERPCWPVSTQCGWCDASSEMKHPAEVKLLHAEMRRARPH